MDSGTRSRCGPGWRTGSSIRSAPSRHGRQMSLERLASQEPEVDNGGLADLRSSVGVHPALDRNAQASHAAQGTEELSIDSGEGVERLVPHGAQIPLQGPAARGLEVEQEEADRGVQPVSGVRTPVKRTGVRAKYR